MTQPRLLTGARIAGGDLAHHHAVHGPLPPVSGAALSEAIERVRLSGRGGGGFPLIRKLELVRESRGRPVVVVNGCEGDPLSEKDRVLLGNAAHLVIDGAFLLARAAGAREVRIALGEESITAYDAVAQALAERSDLREAGVSATIMPVPSGYVSGQETALARLERDRVAKPWTASRRVGERGIARRPTLVSNVETVAQVAILARLGAQGFAAVGTREQPGTALVTVTGAVRSPGVHEVPYGTELTEIVAGAGGLTESPEAMLVGGCAGVWVHGSRVRGLRFCDRDLLTVGARVGLGAIVVLPRSACPTAEVARAAGWLARHAAGQCGPCVHGLSAIAGELSAVRDGTAAAGALTDIERWARLATGRGACSHPDGTARFVQSALQVFAADLEDHRRHGRCDACGSSAVLALPSRRARPRRQVVR